jgi:hypothetical protein
MNHDHSITSPQLKSLEQGLGIHTTKLGAGDKDSAYAMKQQNAKFFCSGVSAIL